MSPRKRTRVATGRPELSRKARSVAATSTGSVRRERAHLDGGAAGHGALAGPVQGGVQVRRLDDPEPAEVLLGLGERPIGGDDLAALGPDHGGRGGVLKATGEHPGPGLPDLFVEARDALVGVLGRRGLEPVRVNGQQVLGHNVLPSPGPAFPVLMLMTKAPPVNRPVPEIYFWPGVTGQREARAC